MTTTETTTYRNGPASIIATRGNRELHILGKSVEAVKAGRTLLAANSFDSLYKSAKSSPAKNVRFINMATR